jgi:multidrug efflux pump
MVPLGAVVDIRDSGGPLTVTRYNMFPAATVTGASQPGVSTGDVLGAMEALSDKELPRSMTSEWTELSYLQKQSSKVEQFRDLRQNPFSAFVLGAVLVFFVLAGLYESWSLPLAVILVVPMCVLSALAGIALAQMDVNIFVQVGFVVLVGLACKNAILIVEFARDRQDEGASRFDAAVEAARVRLRPIVMTSFAFILGVLPLVIAQGAGAEMRRTLGTAVFAGMIGVTLFGIFLTPVFYSVVRWFSGRGLATPESVPAHGSPDGAHTGPTERTGSPGRGEAVRPGEAAPTPAAGGRGDQRGADAVPGDPGVPVVTEQNTSIRRDSALP